MANINKIQLSGNVYDIEDVNATKTIELTQAEYDALVEIDPNAFYVISDAQGIDMSDYYTKTEVDSALSGKQDTLVAGTNITISGNVISAEGGGVDVVQTTGTSTTYVMSQDAVTTQLDGKATTSQAVGSYTFGTTNNIPFLKLNKVATAQSLNSIYYPKINGKGILTNNSTFAQNNYLFSLVETSAITTSVTSGSTDAQVPSAKAVNDKLGGLSLVKLTQAEYDDLEIIDNSTLYIIVDGEVCAPESDTWVTVDDNFTNYNKRVYNLNLSGVTVYEEQPTGSEIGHSISFNLYSEPYTGQNWDYVVDVEFNNLTGEESYSLEILNTANTIVYDSTDSSEDIDLCQILGSGLYLDGTAPEFTYCTSVECTEYECLEYDEETSECIEEGECINYDCANEETAYPLQIKQ